ESRPILVMRGVVLIVKNRIYDLKYNEKILEQLPIGVAILSTALIDHKTASFARPFLHAEGQDPAYGIVSGKRVDRHLPLSYHAVPGCRPLLYIIGQGRWKYQLEAAARAQPGGRLSQ